QPLKVLVVDDEPGVQTLLAEFLAGCGHAVDTASDVPEALRKIASSQLDLIISDMKMPGGSGQDIYKALTDRASHLAPRIVFTSGDGANAETRAFLNETGNPCVSKPFSMQELERAIAIAMRQ